MMAIPNPIALLALSPVIVAMPHIRLSLSQSLTI